MATLGRYFSLLCSTFFALTACLPIGTASGSEREPLAWQLSGFGTAGVVHRQGAAANAAGFRRDDQPETTAPAHTDAGVDSSLGVQLDLDDRGRWRASGQVLLRRRGDRDVELGVETLFVGHALTPSLELRAGRLQAPVYAVSQGRRVDFSQLWMRPPNEVYGLAMLDGLDAVDLNGAFQSPWGQLDATLIAGGGRLSGDATAPRARDLVGGVLVWEPTAGWRARAGALQARVQSPGATADRYRFGGISLFVDQHDWVVHAEFVRRDSRDLAAIDAQGAYLLAGRRLGPWTPYAIAARGAVGRGTADQSHHATLSLGLRHDLGRSLTLKVQIDSMRERRFGESGIGPPPDAPVTEPSVMPPQSHPATTIRSTVIGVAVNFLF